MNKSGVAGWLARRVVPRLPPEVLDALRDRLLDAPTRQSFVHPAVLREPYDGLLEMDPTSYHAPSIMSFSGERTPVRIGRFCSISDTAEIFLGVGHDYRRLSTAPLRWRLGMEADPEPDFDPTLGSITIGNDVFVGWKATILPGVTIGDGAFVAAQSVVSSDVEPYAVVSGNPASVVRYRFEPATRAALGRIRWWYWSDDKIRSEVDALLGHDVAAFVARHDPDAVAVATNPKRRRRRRGSQ